MEVKNEDEIMGNYFGGSLLRDWWASGGTWREGRVSVSRERDGWWWVDCREEEVDSVDFFKKISSN